MKRYLKLIFITVIATFQMNASEKSPPNILLIFMEDLGLQISPYGEMSVPTPALSKLAEESVVFENAYCVQATCSPSRSSLYSGQYPHQTGHNGLAGGFGYYMKDGFTTFLSLLKKKDYFTGFSYKIHVNPENIIRKDYDMAFDIPRFKKDKTNTKDFIQATKYFQEFLANRPEGKPFFYMAQTHDTHEPFSKAPFDKAPALEPYKTMKPSEAEALPSFGSGLKVDGWLAKQISSYYNSIQRVDAFVGNVMKTLEASGEADNTVVLFSADHGPSFTRGKLSTHELGLRVPLMIKWPGTHAAGKRSQELVSLMDISATLVDISEQEIPNKYEGESLKEIAINGKPNKAWRNEFVAEYTSHTTVDYWPMRSIRNKRYKLIENKLVGTPEGEFILAGGRVQTEGGSADMDAGLIASKDSSSYKIYTRVQNPPKYELYDLGKDPIESVNLASNPEFTPILEELLAGIRSWEEKTNDPFRKPEFFNAFTKAQIKKQKEIRAWEEKNGKGKFWGKKVARGNWKQFIEQ